MNILIEISTKNGAFVRQIEVGTHFVPRVGEELILPQPCANLQGCQALMVHEVSYTLTPDNQMQPVVRCRPTPGQGDCTDSARRQLLEELGWLAPKHAAD